MKKLIAISVVFALVAGAVFAVDLGGTVFGIVDVAGAEAGKSATLFGNSAGRARLEGSGEAEIGVGTVGGWLRFDLSGNGAIHGVPAGDLQVVGKAWWKPIEQLKIQIGTNPDGEFDTSHITRYGFYAQANEINNLVASGNNWYNGTSALSDSAIFGGSGTPFFSLSITPVDALSVNFALPLDAGAPIATFRQFFFQVNYNADFGAIHVTFKGNDDTGDYGKIWASTYLGLIENLGIELGLGVGLRNAYSASDYLSAGLGVQYETGSFGIKFRSFFGIPMKSGGDVQVCVDLLPSFAINDSVSIFLDAGILIPGKSQIQWHAAPYVRIGSTWGPGFYAGFHLDGAKGLSGVNWSIPIGILIGF